MAKMSLSTKSNNYSTNGRNDLNKSRKVDTKTVICLAMIAVIGICIRIRFLSYESSDYLIFLREWVKNFRGTSFTEGFNSYKGDYPPLYIYILYIISMLPKNFELYSIKLVSIFFEFVTAFAIFNIGRKNSTIIGLIGFFVTVLFPTFWLNSAKWCQCDSIYTSFCVLSFMFALDGKSARSVLMAGIAFAFKLQTVFYLPILFVFLLNKKIKFRHLFLLVVPYILSIIPVCLIGWPLRRVLTIYISQAGEYNDRLTYNAASLFSIMPNMYILERLRPFLPILAFVWTVALFIVAIVFRNKLNKKIISIFALLFTLGIPWLLPYMHDRYFYLAEVFSIIFIMFYIKLWFAPFLTMVGSLSGYVIYLYGKLQFRDSPGIFAMLYENLLLICVILLFYELKNKDCRKTAK
ncbi:MAG: hypothetical protein LBR30_07860 [Clostridioides sp.]|nr:hypothetical protein [Clostridioides sp.]